MARGRMIVKDVATDARLWEQLSKEARNAFLWIIPHIETNGTTPRDPRALRLSCFPCDKDLRDADMESIIQEWLHTNPALATDEKSPSGTARLMFSDFEMANENLDFFRKRREREIVRTKRTVLDSPRQSAERKKEVKERSERSKERKEYPSASRTEFESFWTAYPRKVAKQRALKAWVKLSPDQEATAKIMADVKARPWPADIAFAPHPATYLNDRRWEDEKPKQKAVVLDFPNQCPKCRIVHPPTVACPR